MTMTIFQTATSPEFIEHPARHLGPAGENRPYQTLVSYHAANGRKPGARPAVALATLCPVVPDCYRSRPAPDRPAQGPRRIL